MPISSQPRAPRLANRKFSIVSLETNRSIRPSLSTSVATAPSALPAPPRRGRGGGWRAHLPARPRARGAPPPPPPPPRRCRDVGERAVSIVAVECVAGLFHRPVKVAHAAVHQEDVHPAIVVVIDES